MSDILRKGDTFQLKDGRGQFLSNGTRQLEVNGKMSFNRPNAFVHLAVAALLAEQLEYPLGSTVEVTTAPKGFIYRFNSTIEPEAGRVPPHFELTLTDLQGWLTRAKADGPETTRLDDLLNPDGRQAIAWMLCALFNTEVTIEHGTPAGIRWLLKKRGR